jgi:hypothetical protein
MNLTKKDFDQIISHLLTRFSAALLSLSHEHLFFLIPLSLLHYASTFSILIICQLTPFLLLYLFFFPFSFLHQFHFRFFSFNNAQT